MAKLTRDDSRLLKSAESLGRMIGTLQRQLEGAPRRFVVESVSDDGDKPPARKASTGGETTHRPARRPAARKNAARKTGPPKVSARKLSTRKTAKASGGKRSAASGLARKAARPR